MENSNVNAYIVKQRKKKIVKIITVISVTVICFVMLFFLYLKIDRSIKEQSIYSVRDSVINAAVECYAVEGKYPSSLEYLEENYGLKVNHRDYIISYEAFSDNMLPEIKVLVKGEG